MPARRLLIGGGAPINEDSEDEAEQMNISTENTDQYYLTDLNALLSFELSAVTDDNIVREYDAEISAHPSIAFNSEAFLLSVVRRSLIKHILELLHTWGLGLKLFWQLNCVFVRNMGQTGEEGQKEVQTQSIFIPFRQPSVTFSVINEDFIAETIMNSIEIAIDKQNHFLNMGSGWALSSYLSVMLRVAHLGHEVGNIGHIRFKKWERLYGPNGLSHNASDQTCILPNVLFSFCDSDGFCFCYALGASLFSWDQLRTGTSSEKTDSELQDFKQSVLNKAFNTYDFSMINAFPCSFADIIAFEKANKHIVNLCVMGMFRSGKATGERSRTKKIKVWPIFKSDKLLENPNNLKIVNLVIVQEQSNELNMVSYHVAFCRDFQELMKRSGSRLGQTLTKNIFCIGCFAGFKEADIAKHKAVCSLNEPQSLTIQRFYKKGTGCRFSYEEKRRPAICFGAVDLECASKPLTSQNEVGMFGPMAAARSQFIAVSFSSQSYLNVEGAEAYQLLSKTYVGRDPILNFFRLLMFESAYFASILNNKLTYPLRMSHEQSELASCATHCGNCKKWMPEGSKVYHHDHAIGPETSPTNFISVCCPRCNQKFRRKTPYFLSAHNLRSFESAFIVSHILKDPRCADLFDDIQIFTKGADNVSSMRLVFKCFLCNPQILMRKRLKFLVPSDRQDQVNSLLDKEFEKMHIHVNEYVEKERIRPRIARERAAAQLHNEAVLADMHDDDHVDDDDDDDDDEYYDDDEDDDDELDEVVELDDGVNDNVQDDADAPDAQGDPALSGGERHPPPPPPHSLPPRPRRKDDAMKTCPHGRSFRMLIVKDSLALTCASLQKTVDACARSFQPKVCGKNAAEVGFWSELYSKDCDCCKNLYLIREQGQILCKYVLDYFGDLSLIDVCFSKALFPYQYVDKLINSDDGSFNAEALNHPIPSRNHFNNSLSDSGELPSQEEYDELRSNLELVGAKTFGDYLLHYNSCDSIHVLICLLTIERFYFQHFDLSIMRYNSLPRFGYDILLRSCAERAGGDGSVEFVHDESQRLFLREANTGGLQLCARNGGNVEMMNCIELPHFDSSKPQTKCLSLDINSLFPFSFFAYPLPKSSYQLHESDSDLINEMNQILLERGRQAFIDFYNKIIEKNSTFYLIEVSIHYPEALHDVLDVVPSFRKRAVRGTELSEAQRSLLEQLGLKGDFDKKVLIADLNDQTVIVSFQHLALLVDLGVELVSFSRCMTAFQSFCFRDAIGKLLELKKNAATPYFRSLAKQAANSSYGTTGLVPERFEVVGVARGQQEIVRAVSSPHLNRFKILSPNSIITYKQKESVKCESLFFVNVAIQQHSKTYFLRSYYFSIKKVLTDRCLRLGLLVSLSALYCDTDSISARVSTQSYNDVGVYLKTSDIMYELRDIIDFSTYLAYPNHRMFQELKARLSEQEFTEFIDLIQSTQSEAGLFKNEISVSSFSSEIEFFYTLRSKAYIMKVGHSHAPDSNTPVSYTYKKTLKGPILRERLKKFTTEDYLAMGRGESDYESCMSKISSRNWSVYLADLKRRRPTIFSKCRYLVDASTGVTRPHGHKDNPASNRVDSVVVTMNH